LLGNLIQYRLSHAKYLINAQKYFDSGDYNLAQIELNNCVKFLKNERCSDASKALKDRIELGNKANDLIYNHAVDLDGKILMLKDLAEITSDRKSLNKFRDAMWQKRDTVFQLYEKALIYIKKGDLNKATLMLDKVNGLWTDFGHNRFLNREIKQLNQRKKFELTKFFANNKNDVFNYPYLYALHRMGIKNYANYTAESSTLALNKF